MLEIRGHARGGQGMVTAFEILAKIFSKLGDFHVQSFLPLVLNEQVLPFRPFCVSLKVKSSTEAIFISQILSLSLMRL